MADGEVQLMYLLFRHHHVMPGTYIEMGPGERRVARAFMHFEAERRNEEIESMEKIWG